MAIIGILASLLLPSLSGAKSRTRSVVSQNNLKQLQLVWLSYTGDSDGKMVPNEEGRPFGFWEGARHSWVLGNAQQDMTPDNIENGTLF